MLLPRSLLSSLVPSDRQSGTLWALLDKRCCLSWTQSHTSTPSTTACQRLGNACVSCWLSFIGNPNCQREVVSLLLQSPLLFLPHSITQTHTHTHRHRHRHTHTDTHTDTHRNTDTHTHTHTHTHTETHTQTHPGYSFCRCVCTSCRYSRL